jgi:hypothetical protein
MYTARPVRYGAEHGAKSALVASARAQGFFFYEKGRSAGDDPVRTFEDK